jgi:pSer/pThr/pTyr-binding forkhead associated (FHA) protein
VSILSDFEDRVGRAVEGGFARVFRSPVQPAELARKLGKEMDRSKALGVGKVYAPTMYSVLLSPQDDSALGGFADTLSGELETYLIGYARERNYTLTTRPVVRFLIDPELRLGRFDVIGELLSPEEIAAEMGDDGSADAQQEPAIPASRGAEASAPATRTAAPLPVAPPPPVSATSVFDAAAPPAPSPTPAAPKPASVTIHGVDDDIVLSGDRAVVGRLSTCDVCLADANASREHAVFEREGTGWAIRDLGSTNGTLLNGAPLKRERLRDGDVVVVGITEIIYHEARG